MRHIDAEKRCAITYRSQPVTTCHDKPLCLPPHATFPPTGTLTARNARSSDPSPGPTQIAGRDPSPTMRHGPSPLPRSSRGRHPRTP